MQFKVTLLIAVVFLAACGNEYPKQIGKFIDVCMDRGVTKPAWSCALEKTNNHYVEKPTIERSSNRHESSPASIAKRFTDRGAEENILQSSRQAIAKSLCATTSASASVNDSVRQSHALKSNIEFVSGSPDKLSEAIREYSKQLSAKQGGNEYVEGRKTLKINFNNNGTADMVALILMEGIGGGNSTIASLVLFEYEQGNYIPVDTAIVEGAHDISLTTNSLLNVDSLIHSLEDPHCCPTIATQHRFSLKKNRLVRLD
jgi:hypothetical protein